MDAVTLMDQLFKTIDAVLIVSIVVIIEITKNVFFKKAPAWVWFFALIAGSCIAATIKIPVVHAAWKSFFYQSILYSAAALLLYTTYKVTRDGVQKRAGKK
jgi:hypothetical protein